MVALIALAVVGAMSALSGSIQTSFTKVSDTMTASNNAH